MAGWKSPLIAAHDPGRPAGDQGSQQVQEWPGAPWQERQCLRAGEAEENDGRCGDGGGVGHRTWKGNCPYRQSVVLPKNPRIEYETGESLCSF